MKQYLRTPIDVKWVVTIIVVTGLFTLLLGSAVHSALIYAALTVTSYGFGRFVTDNRVYALTIAVLVLGVVLIGVVVLIDAYYGVDRLIGVYLEEFIDILVNDLTRDVFIGALVFETVSSMVTRLESGDGVDQERVQGDSTGDAA